MKNLYKKNLLGWLLVAVCLMNLTHGFAQINSRPIKNAISSEYKEKGIGSVMNNRHSCGIIIELFDTWGDGWNDNKLRFSFDDGTPDIEMTLFTGSSNTETIEIGNGAHVTLSWINGQFPSECSFVVKYENDDVIYTCSGPSSGVLYEFDCSCSSEMEEWNLMNSFTLSSGGQQGIATDGNYIYSCSWMSNPSGGYSFYKYNMQGTFIEGFDIEGASEIIDLAYDGQFFYGSNRSNYLYKMDFSNKTLVSTISTTCTSIWFCTYYPETDGFWVGQSNLRLINRNGQTIKTAPAAVGTMGIAYYKDANNIDHLYLFSQGENNDKSLVYDYNITTNTLETNPIFDFEALPGYDITDNPEAGGAFIGNYNGKTAFFGNVQQNPNLVGVYELESTSPEGFATVILTAGNLWNDGSGYQMLLDADAMAYGTYIPETGGLTSSGDAAPEVYAQFEYKIPINADGAMTTQNIVINNSIAIEIPAGVYDWCITNPTPGDRIWIAGSNGNIGGRQNDFTFEAGNTYKFEAKRFGNNDGVDLTITETPSSCVISASADPYFGGIVSGAGNYDAGSTCTLTAMTNNGYMFVNWTKDGNPVSVNSVYAFTVTENATYVAHFTPLVNSFTITATADPAEGGSVTGGGNYTQGEECTLTATPNNGYTFVNWTKNGNTVSDNSVYAFTVTENATYVAHFAMVNGYTISVSANPSEGGVVTGAGIYAPGITITLTAMANDGYKFLNWTENGVIQCLTDQYEIVVDHDRTLVANFEALPTYTISAMASANGTISPQGDVQVVKGSDQTFTMISDLGACILKVLVDGIDVGSVESYTFQNVDRDHTIYVLFSGMGVEEAQILNVNVYPNPAKDMVFVEGEGIETVALYDMLGNCLRSMDYNLGKELNVSGLSRGTYILRLTTQDGRVGYKKLMVTD